MSNTIENEHPVYYPADEANERLTEMDNDLADLRAENERLRCLLMPSHFITAPQVLLWLEDFKGKLNLYVERAQVQCTIDAIRRLQGDPGATHGLQVRVKP
ncbi:MAG: hypothetical protein ACYDHZ_00580 [Dehalococcoidia bacterium]